MRHTTSKLRPKVSGSRLHAARRSAEPSLNSIAAEIGPVVYAVRTKDGLIKIGHTARLAKRSYEVGGGIRAILALRPGSRDDEAALHATLRASRARGVEYYTPTAEVLAVVNEMRSAYGLQPLDQVNQ